ncbi:MAG: hypothetical protein ABI369_06230 [Acetobacteraceae bacterium]
MEQPAAERLIAELYEHLLGSKPSKAEFDCSARSILHRNREMSSALCLNA